MYVADVCHKNICVGIGYANVADRMASVGDVYHLTIWGLLQRVADVM